MVWPLSSPRSRIVAGHSWDWRTISVLRSRCGCGDRYHRNPSSPEDTRPLASPHQSFSTPAQPSSSDHAYKGGEQVWGIKRINSYSCSEVPLWRLPLLLSPFPSHPPSVDSRIQYISSADLFPHSFFIIIQHAINYTMQAKLFTLIFIIFSALQALAAPFELVPRSCKVAKCLISWTPTMLSCFKAAKNPDAFSAGICGATIVNLGVNPSGSCGPCYDEIGSWFHKKEDSTSTTSSSSTATPKTASASNHVNINSLTSAAAGPPSRKKEPSISLSKLGLH